MKNKDQIILESLYEKIVLRENVQRVNQTNDRHIETDDGNISIIQLFHDGSIYVDIQGFFSNVDDYLMDVLEKLATDRDFSEKIKNSNIDSKQGMDFSGFGKKHNMDTEKITNSSESLLTFGPFSEVYDTSQFIKKIDEFLSSNLTGYLSKNGKGDVMIDNMEKKDDGICSELDKDYSGLVYTLNRLGNYPSTMSFLKKMFFNLYVELCFDLYADPAKKHMESLEIKQNREPLSKIVKDSLLEDWMPKLVIHSITSFDSELLGKIEKLCMRIHDMPSDEYIKQLYFVLFNSRLNDSEIKNHSEKIDIIDEINDTITKLIESNPYINQ
jgi:hypothetical protein